MSTRKRLPKFTALRIVFAGLSLYFVLFASLWFFLGVKDLIREGIQAGHGPSSPAVAAGLPAFGPPPASTAAPRVAPAEKSKPPSLFVGIEDNGQHVGSPVLALIISLIVLRVYHGPVYRAFRKIRKGIAVSAEEKSRALKRLVASPYTLSLIPTGILVVATIGALFIKKGQDESATILLPWINVVSLVMAGLFIFICQRHRVQTKYISLLADASLPASGRRVSVKATFILITAISVVLPLAFTFLLLGSGLSLIKDFEALGPAELRIVLGSDVFADPGNTLSAGVEEEIHSVLGSMPLYYVTVFDTLRVTVALVTVLLIVLIYVAFIALWTSHDIISPIMELGRGMHQVAKGDFAGLSVIPRGNDELGDLVTGFNRMVGGLEERDKVKSLFGRYMSKELSEAILTGRVNTDGDRFEVTVLFADIRGFTSMSEDLPPEEVFAFLNAYLERMTRVLALHNGMIDKFLGDGILVGFGLPVATGTHAADALAGARAMLGELAIMNADREAAGLPVIRVGIGLHSGPVFAGNQGSSIKSQYTMIGDTVNVASRIEDLTKERGHPILLSDSTYALLPEESRQSLISLEPARLRGKAEPVLIWGQE